MKPYDPAARRAITLKRFGLTPGQYDMLLRIQHGVCALCLRSPKIGGTNLHVDHCHKTLAIRGLLCHRCNRALGYLSDPAALARAAAYVQQHTGYYMPKKKRKKTA